MPATKRSKPAANDAPAAVKTQTRDQFDKWAQSYDRSRLNELVFFPSVRACLEEILRWRWRDGRQSYELLDVGCGTGRLLHTLARDAHATRLVGLDYSPEMVTRAASKFAVANQPDRLHVLQGDAEDLPFEDGSFDVLTCCNSFHHYPHQLTAIREFKRVLRDGGVLILIDGFRDNVIGWVIFDVGVSLIEQNVHHASWSLFRQFFTEAGFREIHQRKMNVLAPLLVNVAIA